MSSKFEDHWSSRYLSAMLPWGRVSQHQHYRHLGLLHPFWCQGRDPAYCAVFSSTLCLYVLDASSNSSFQQSWHSQGLMLPNVSWGGGVWEPLPEEYTKVWRKDFSIYWFYLILRPTASPTFFAPFPALQPHYPLLSFQNHHAQPHYRGFVPTIPCLEFSCPCDVHLSRPLLKRPFPREGFLSTLPAICSAH